ncbi:putative tellurite resistance protein B-like protein [Rhodoblastus acidophilus]|uniref:tellurite resistance TerB family protein n=1 Tax=Rhodoblastus acidophilus TaxID=1074 RepID=UPI002225097B|nr:TerB family tellurite resistance protein [Rhodoblastus acidophilus]MCW2285178.1 putative tellurite resistance protein B-like protein [Rhodoblastus acidophilus]MCW2334134.1 putative tellurite resistance protein B-like protein [Rhodoblastus acidophilus]
MFDRIRQFVEELTGAPSERELGDTELRVASAALLVHVAEVDGFFSESERRALLLLLQQRFDVSEAQAQELMEAGRRSDREAVDLYRFTSVLKDSTSLPERRRMIEMMWTVAYADGELAEFEENVIWRVSELLAVPSRDRIALRQKVRGDFGLDPLAPAPWDSHVGESKA